MPETNHSGTERIAPIRYAMSTLTPRQVLRATTVLILVLALAGPSLPSAAGAATSGGWTTSASVSSTSVGPGASVTFTTTVKSSTKTKALVDLEIHSPTRGKVHQQVWRSQSFSSSQTRTYTSTWTVPADASEESLSVSIGVFDTDWSPLHHWNDGAASFEVVVPEASPPAANGYAAGGWTTSVTPSPASVAPGAAVTLSASVLADSGATALVDLELHGASGKVFQKVWPSESFSAGVTRELSTSWTVPSDAAAGSYTVKIGVFDTDWSPLHHWNDGAAQLEITGGAPEPVPSEPSPSDPVPTEPSPSAPVPGGSGSLPAGWPSSVELGLGSNLGDAAALRATAPFGFRNKYLAGGVNTGSGWATWNPDGGFVPRYVRESRDVGIIPVFTYYMLYQSKPGASMGEKAGLQANLADSSTMAAYYRDLTLFFQRAADAGGTTVLHVEPDLWAYLQQLSSGDDGSTVPVKVAASGVSDLAGLPDTAAGLAQAIVRLRDRYAPNVLLGYHYSKWGTGNDFLYTDPSDSTVATLGQRTAAFYASLGATFDVAFHDLSDRDAAFKQYVYGDGGKSWFTADDYRRSTVYVDAFTDGTGLRTVLWQLPLGNTKMRAMNNTRHHYQDNKVEWLLDEPARAHIDAYTQAGVVAYIFGAGAGGATTASDTAKDGITNPDPINGNTRMSLSADDDGGFFRDRAASYYNTGATPLPS